MIPRGEVGLIFANMGLTLVVGGQAVVDQSVFSAVIVMVMATTLVTPPLLQWSFARFARTAAPVSETFELAEMNVGAAAMEGPIDISLAR